MTTNLLKVEELDLPTCFALRNMVKEVRETGWEKMWNTLDAQCTKLVQDNISVQDVRTLQDIMLLVWDPIGLGDFCPGDEYHSYLWLWLSHIVNSDGRCDEELVESLTDFSDDMFGESSPSGCMETINEFRKHKFLFDALRTSHGLVHFADCVARKGYRSIARVCFADAILMERECNGDPEIAINKMHAMFPPEEIVRPHQVFRLNFTEGKVLEELRKHYPIESLNSDAEDDVKSDDDEQESTAAAENHQRDDDT